LFCIAFFPIYVVLLQGQDVLLFVLLLTLAFLALQENSDWAAGVYLGLGLFRFHLLAPIVLGLLFQRRLKALATFSLTALALFGLSVESVGLHTTLLYPRYVAQIENDILLRQTVVLPNMTNLRALLDALFGRMVPQNVDDVLAIILSAALAVYTAVIWRKTPVLAFKLGFAACLIATLLSAYHGLIHDSSVLILASVVVADYALSRGAMNRDGLMLLLPVFVLSFTPLQALLWYRRWQGGVIPATLLFWLWRCLRAERLPGATTMDFVSSASTRGGSL